MIRLFPRLLSPHEDIKEILSADGKELYVPLAGDRGCSLGVVQEGQLTETASLAEDRGGADLSLAGARLGLHDGNNS